MIEEIVTLVGESGKRRATITMDTETSFYKVKCERLDVEYSIFKFFMVESEAQKYAEEFTWEKEYGTV
jgi:hypothetical protein